MISTKSTESEETEGSALLTTSFNPENHNPRLFILYSIHNHIIAILSQYNLNTFILNTYLPNTSSSTPH